MQPHPINPTPSATSTTSASTATAIQILRLTHAAKHLGIGEPTMRQIRHYSEDRFAANGQVVSGNGFAPAFLKLGRAVYVDVAKFTEIWRGQQVYGGVHG